MNDEFDALRATRAPVDPPSAAARAAARQRWSGVATTDLSASGLITSELTATDLTTTDLTTTDLDRRRGYRARAFTARVAVAALLAVALATGAWIVSRDRVASVKPLHIATITSLVPSTGSQPQVFLLVGSDSRAFVQSQQDKEHFGDPDAIDGARSDTMIAVRIDPQTQQVLAVSLPRDLLVDIAGCGKEKLDAALNPLQTCSGKAGGTNLLVQTITRDLGVPVNHVIEVQFPQFATLAGELGGLRVNFPVPARDRESGLAEPAGCQTLSSAEALAFVRARHLEWLVDGTWREDETADLGRMTRQRLALGQLAAAAEARVGTDPRPLLRELFAHVTVDAGFTSDDALHYFAALHGDQTITTTLPTKPMRFGDQDVLVAAPNAQSVLDALAGHGAVTAVPKPGSLSNPQTIATAC